MSDKFMDVYSTLREEFGHQQWWPADDPFEVMVGAILTQNTNWKNVEKALENMREENLLDSQTLSDSKTERIQEAIRPAGYYRQKSARLVRLAQWVIKEGSEHENVVDSLMDRPVDELRMELLAINGIGPETADSILLYALNKPVFVVDTYTMRVFSRHEMLEPRMSYREVQETFMYSLPDDLDLLRDYHAQLVEVGKRYCSKSNPSCEECPLRAVLGDPVLEPY